MEREEITFSINSRDETFGIFEIFVDTINHSLIVFSSGYLTWYCFYIKNSEPIGFHAWFCAMGYQLLLAEGIRIMYIMRFAYLGPSSSKK